MKLNNFISQVIGWGLILFATYIIYYLPHTTQNGFYAGALYIFCYAMAGLMFSTKHLKNKE